MPSYILICTVLLPMIQCLLTLPNFIVPFDSLKDKKRTINGYMVRCNHVQDPYMCRTRYVYSQSFTFIPFIKIVMDNSSIVIISWFTLETSYLSLWEKSYVASFYFSCITFNFSRRFRLQMCISLFPQSLFVILPACRL